MRLAAMADVTETVSSSNSAASSADKLGVAGIWRQGVSECGRDGEKGVSERREDYLDGRGRGYFGVGDNWPPDNWPPDNLSRYHILYDQFRTKIKCLSDKWQYI